jgi:hypothetical protein
VVEVADEVVGEELLGGAKLAAGSMGRGNDQSGLPSVRRSRRKMAVGKSRGLASLAGVVGRLLAQEGRRDEALLLARSDNSRWLVSDGQRWAKQRPAWSRAARHAARRGRAKVKWATAPSDDVRSSAKEWPTHVGGDDRRPPAPSALHAVSEATGNRGGSWDRATLRGGQTKTGR